MPNEIPVMRRGLRANQPSSGLTPGEPLLATDRHTLHAALDGETAVPVVVAIDELATLLGAGVVSGQDYLMIHDADAEGVKEKRILVSELLVGLGGIPASQRGAADGVATLGSDAKVPLSQLPDAILGALKYQGAWDAATNSPSVPAASSTNRGHYYVVSTAGATSMGGHSDWEVGDWLVSSGSSWGKVDNSDKVSSVAGRTGAVVLTKADVGLGSLSNDAQLKVASNLADLPSAATARSNLGLGSMATQDAADVAVGDLEASGDVVMMSTGAMTMPSGTSAQRPAGAVGKMRMNTTTGLPEWYDVSTSTWVPFNAAAYDVEYLVLGGGGGGGGSQGGIGTYNTGGGGGGGYKSGSLRLFSMTTYPVVVGSGGSGGSGIGAGGAGAAGGSSSFRGIVATGGGGATTSGGGASGDGPSNPGGLETASATWGAGGGGGAGSAGSNGTTTSGGNGGAGIEWPAGSGTYYGGGGGGGIYVTVAQTPGAGGTGGGGTAPTGNGNGSHGTDGLGGGGSGAGAQGGAGLSNYTGGSGGSGTAVVRYPGPQRGVGGTVTSAGGYTYHTFTAGGSFVA